MDDRGLDTMKNLMTFEENHFKTDCSVCNMPKIIFIDACPSSTLIYIIQFLIYTILLINHISSNFLKGQIIL